jgi:hypothetical protein
VCQWGNVIAPLALRLPDGANILKSAPQGERPSAFRVVKDGQEVPPSELPVQKAAATGQEVRESEIIVVFDDGTAREMLGNASLLDGEGKVRGAICVFVDTTEHKRAEQALQESQAALDRVARIVQCKRLAALACRSTAELSRSAGSDDQRHEGSEPGERRHRENSYAAEECIP